MYHNTLNLQNKENTMQLSKYLTQAGVCSRRKAAELIKSGCVTVNGTIITQPWHKVPDDHAVKVHNRVIRLEKKIYIILNKPKGYISTVSDEHGRKTVLDLVKPHIKERLYPIGRLDYDTTGLLLLTNDGNLAQQLAHPKYQVKKVYRAILDRPITQADAQLIQKGIHLPDGFVKVDYLDYSPRSKSALVTLHSGKYRVIKRLFARVGYHVLALERIQYAHLSARGMPVGSWKFLSEKDIKKLITEPIKG
jgi:23S rRNA pseudouridine2605 synthase